MSDEPLLRIHNQNTTQNKHVCVICCEPEVVSNVISGQNVKIVKGYVAQNFKYASCSSFRELQKEITL